MYVVKFIIGPRFRWHFQDKFQIFEFLPQKHFSHFFSYPMRWKHAVEMKVCGESIFGENFQNFSIILKISKILFHKHKFWSKKCLRPQVFTPRGKKKEWKKYFWGEKWEKLDFTSKSAIFDLGYQGRICNFHHLWRDSIIIKTIKRLSIP